VDLSHTDKAVELGKLIPGSVFAEIPSSASMEGDEFDAAFEAAQGDGDPAMKKSNTLKEEWTNLAGPPEKGFVKTREKVWMKMDVIGIGERDIKIKIKGLFERINPLTYSATFEDNNFFIYEKDEQLKMNFPLVLKLSKGRYVYKFADLGSSSCKTTYGEVSEEIPDTSPTGEKKYQFELLFTEQD